MLDQFKQRSYELEHLDTGNYTAEEYEGCIVELQKVNRWLGDTKALRDTLLAEVNNKALRSFSMLDVGAGSGELLRVASRWAKDSGVAFHGVGLELNTRSAQAIIAESSSDIDAVRADALKLPFLDNAFDYVICSLFTHHFVDQSVIAILREMSRVARRKIFVIDLHRHPVAYLLYTTVGKLFLHERLLREDGALSILRSFKSNELAELGKQAGLNNVSVSRHFPFRLVLSADIQRSSAYSAPEIRTHRAA
ncbi:MAG TPA: methyltransferase domain-containing protein [Pyrinomonadaceae bacterium]